MLETSPLRQGTVNEWMSSVEHSAAGGRAGQADRVPKSPSSPGAGAAGRELWETTHPELQSRPSQTTAGL